MGCIKNTEFLNMCFHVFNYLPNKWLHILNNFVVISFKGDLGLKDLTSFAICLILLLLQLSIPHSLQSSLLNFINHLSFQECFNLFFRQELVLPCANLSDVWGAVVFFEVLFNVDEGCKSHSVTIRNNRINKSFSSGERGLNDTLGFFELFEFFVGFVKGLF